MKISLWKLISSAFFTIVLLVVYAAALAGATFLEKGYGTLMAKTWVYYSPLFILWQFLMVVNFIAIAIRFHLFRWRKWGFVLTHIAFIVILSGAFISHVLAVDGFVHIREGESTDELVIQTDREHYVQRLPFKLELVKFTLTRYPGSDSPSSYESDLLVHVDGATREERVFMNNVLDVKGYRFFQASYDPDEKGTVLSVSRDVAGRTVTYVGYALLLLGLLGSIFGSGSRFRELARRLKSFGGSSAFGVALLFMMVANGSLPVRAAVDKAAIYEVLQKYTIDERHAAAFAAMPVQSNRGRMSPINTFSSEILRKLYKQEKIGALNSDQFLLSLLAMPEMWMRVPLLHQSNQELATYYGLSPETCAFIELFDERGNYKLQEKVEEAYHKNPVERTRFDKDLMKLDEQANIFNQLVNKQMIHIFPKADDPNHKWYAPGDDLSAFSGKDSMFVSRIFDWYLGEVRNALKSGDWSKADEVLEMIRTYQDKRSTPGVFDMEKIQSEVTYNRLDLFRWCKIGYLVFGGLLLALSIAALFVRRRWMVYCTGIFSVGILAVFLCHIYGMGMRWYIGGYAPWSNSYETMVYVAWATVLGGLLFVRRSPVTLALASLFGGVILFVSGLNWMDPEINPLVPVLKSPWLMFHVAVIVAAYGFFGVGCLLGITNMGLMAFGGKKRAALLSARISELTVINEMALWIGLALMTIGTFLGAIWANVSWGRYWGWDPKETWALVTMVLYAVVLHLRLVKRWYSTWSFNFLSVLCFSSVLMTFLGVNYFLSGMHSYGENEHVGGLFGYLIVILILLVLLGVFSKRHDPSK